MKKYLLLTLMLFSSLVIGAINIDVDSLRSPDQAKIWSLPSATDTIVGRVSTDTLQNKTIDRLQNTFLNLGIMNSDVDASAGIAYNKLASLATGQVLLGNAGVPTATTLSGGATVGATGVVTLGNSAVITQLLTGYTSGAGTISSSDSILQAIQKLNGNTQITNTAIAALDIDWSATKAAGGIYTKTLSANSTFTFSNRTSGQTIVVRLTNTASNYTVTWPTVKWSGGTAPTMTTGAKSDVYTFIFDGTDVYGSALQNF